MLVNGVDLHYTVEGEGFPCLVPRPANTYVAFERSGHYPFYEEPELFDTALLEWLDTRAAT